MEGLGGAGTSRLVGSGVVGTGQSSWTYSGGILKLITDMGCMGVFCEEMMFEQSLSSFCILFLFQFFISL